jgi:very-short-patch-repair endonuclease
MNFLNYQKSFKEFSRYYRKKSTLSELLLWNELRAGKRQKILEEMGLKFIKDDGLNIKFDLSK